MDISIWDYPAAYLIVLEAGGVISDIDGNDIKFGLTMIASNNQEDYLKYLSD